MQIGAKFGRFLLGLPNIADTYYLENAAMDLTLPKEFFIRHDIIKEMMDANNYVTITDVCNSGRLKTSDGTAKPLDRNELGKVLRKLPIKNQRFLKALALALDIKDEAWLIDFSYPLKTFSEYSEHKFPPTNLPRVISTKDEFDAFTFADSSATPIGLSPIQVAKPNRHACRAQDEMFSSGNIIEIDKGIELLTPWSTDLILNSISMSQPSEKLIFLSTYFPEGNQLCKRIFQKLNDLKKSDFAGNNIEILALFLNKNSCHFKDRFKLHPYGKDNEHEQKIQIKEFLNMKSAYSDIADIEVKTYDAWPMGHLVMIGSRIIFYGWLWTKYSAVDGPLMIVKNSHHSLWQRIVEDIEAISSHKSTREIDNGYFQ